MNRKIALGTVQFGMDYGINNVRGKIPGDEVLAILDEAWRVGIDMLDTASSYGNCELVLGEYFKKYSGRFKIVSKLPRGNASEVKNLPAISLERLGVERIYGYLLHNIKSFAEDPAVWEVMVALKKEGKAEKIGFSLYYPNEIDFLLERGIEFDLVQLPYNVLDRRFENKFQLLKCRGIEIHARSIFLQGIVFKNPEDLPDYLCRLVGRIGKLQDISKRSGFSVLELCLGFVLAQNAISRVVVGVDRMDHLKEIITLSSVIEFDSETITELDDLREDDERLILPVNWK